jgi:hypothetical protein
MERCSQCNSDLHVHRLLQEVREGIQVRDLQGQSETILQSLSPVRGNQGYRFQVIFQTITTLSIVAGIIFCFYAGLRFLNFLDHEGSVPHTPVPAKWSESAITQLQQMNGIIKQELDIIVDQRNENRFLQGKLQAFNTTPTPAQEIKNAVSASQN